LVAAEKATLLKMAPRVLSMELGRSPREKTGRSSRDNPWRGAEVAGARCKRRSPDCLLDLLDAGGWFLIGSAALQVCNHVSLSKW